MLCVRKYRIITDEANAYITIGLLQNCDLTCFWKRKGKGTASRSCFNGFLPGAPGLEMTKQDNMLDDYIRKSNK